MADEQHTRRADLGATEPRASTSQAGATPRVEWDRLHFEYARLNALRIAALAWGPAAREGNTLALFKGEMIDKHGSWTAAFDSATDGAACAARFHHADQLLDLDGASFFDPATRAAVELALTPAPDLTALLKKIDVIRDHELDNCTWMTRPVMDVIQEDAARVTAWHAEAVACRLKPPV